MRRLLPVLPLLLAVGTLVSGAGVAPEHAGRTAGTFRLSYYYMAQERDVGPWPLYGPGCRRVLHRTSRRFHRALSREGSGRLTDGRVVNFETRCACAAPGFEGARTCYSVLDGTRYPWGRGALALGGFYALYPLRSLAVDPAVIPIGEWVFIPQLKDRMGPTGRRLDGCFRAEDTGRKVRGHHVDLFAGTAQHAGWMQRRFGLREVTVIRHHPRCPP